MTAMGDFSDWLTQKYIEFRGNSVGHDRSVTEFAKWIGVPQPVVSDWMNKNGRKPKSHKSIELLVARFGVEVYDVLGLPKPLYVRELRAVPQALRERFLSAAEEISTAIYGTAMDPESPEALKIAESIMEKHGFKLTDTTQ